MRVSLALPALVPDRRLGLRGSDESLGRFDLRLNRAVGSFEQRRHATGVEDIEGARLQLRCEKRASHGGHVLRLDHDRARRLRQRVQTEAHARDEGEEAFGSADESPEVVARDVLHDLAARIRDRAVGENERSRRDEVARRAEAVAEWTGDVAGEQRADRRISRWVE